MVFISLSYQRRHLSSWDSVSFFWLLLFSVLGGVRELITKALPFAMQHIQSIKGLTAGHWQLVTSATSAPAKFSEQSRCAFYMTSGRSAHFVPIGCAVCFGFGGVDSSVFVTLFAGSRVADYAGRENILLEKKHNNFAFVSSQNSED